MKDILSGFGNYEEAYDKQTDWQVGQEIQSLQHTIGWKCMERMWTKIAECAHDVIISPDTEEKDRLVNIGRLEAIVNLTSDLRKKQEEFIKHS